MKRFGFFAALLAGMMLAANANAGYHDPAEEEEGENDDGGGGGGQTVQEETISKLRTAIRDGLAQRGALPADDDRGRTITEHPGSIGVAGTNRSRGERARRSFDLGAAGVRSSVVGAPWNSRKRLWTPTQTTSQAITFLAAPSLLLAIRRDAVREFSLAVRLSPVTPCLRSPVAGDRIHFYQTVRGGCGRGRANSEPSGCSHGGRLGGPRYQCDGIVLAWGARTRRRLKWLWPWSCSR